MLVGLNNLPLSLFKSYLKSLPLSLFKFHLNNLTLSLFKSYLKSLNVPFLGLYPAFTRFLNAFLPNACFLRLTMRPLCFIKSLRVKPPEVCLADPCHTCALEPVAGTLRVALAPPVIPEIRFEISATPAVVEFIFYSMLRFYHSL